MSELTHHFVTVADVKYKVSGRFSILGEFWITKVSTMNGIEVEDYGEVYDTITEMMCAAVPV